MGMGSGSSQTTGVPKVDVFFDEFRKRGLNLDLIVYRAKVQSVRVERVDQDLLGMKHFHFSDFTKSSDPRRNQIFVVSKSGSLMREVGVRTRKGRTWYGAEKLERMEFDETLGNALALGGGFNRCALGTLLDLDISFAAFYVVVFTPWNDELVVYKPPKNFDLLMDWIEVQKKRERQKFETAIEQIDAEGNTTGA